MRVAIRFGDKSAIIADLSPTVLYLLAAPSTPDAAIDEILEGGKKVSVAEAKEIIADRMNDRAAYQRAWEEYRALLTGLIADENFWHISFATRLLPHLLDARQEIAELI